MPANLIGAPNDPLGPITRWRPVTPSDSADLDILPRAVWATGDAGVIVITDGDGTDCPYPVQPGQWIIARPVRIKATGTTATGVFIGW